MTFLYIKIIGTFIVLISGSGLGYLYGQDMIIRHKQLRELKRSFSIIYGDISYGAMSLGDIFAHVKRQCSPDFYLWLDTLEEGVKSGSNQNFATLWEDGIKDRLASTHLSPLDKEELLQAGQTLGTVDKSQQLALLSLYMEGLEATIQEVGEEKNKRQKMCNVLGVVASVFIVVFLF